MAGADHRLAVEFLDRQFREVAGTSLDAMVGVFSTARLGRRSGRASADSVEVIANRIAILVGLGRER